MHYRWSCFVLMSTILACAPDDQVADEKPVSDSADAGESQDPIDDDSDDAGTEETESDGDDSGGDDSQGDDSQGDDSGGDDNGDGADDATGFEPIEGIWTVTQADLSSDECGLSEYVDRGEPGSTMDLQVADASAFEITFNAESDTSGGGEQTLCDMGSDQSYLCDPTQDESTLAQDYGLSALILVDMTVDGLFVAEDEMDMSTQVDLSCDGDDCGWVEIFLGASFPCTMVMDSLLVAG